MEKYFKNTIIYLLLFFSSITHPNIVRAEALQQPTGREALQLYHTAEPTILRETFEEAIANAKESILIFTFSFSDLKFIELINQKAEEGIDVIVVINKDHRGPLLAYGSDKLHILTQYHEEGRMHHKILLIDDSSLWLGSANFSASAFNSQENFVVGVESKELAKALRHEAAVFQGLQLRADNPTQLENFGDQEVALFLLPHVDPYDTDPEQQINQRGKQELLSLIHNAKSHIQIAMMVWTDPELEQAILDAHQRGVCIEVLLQDLQGVTPNNLKRAGVFVTTNPNLNLMHNKWMWVDEAILVNGSANWSRSSFSRNDESFLVIKKLHEKQKLYLKNYRIELLIR